MTSLFIALALCFTGTGMWVASYWAPHCPMPANQCRQFMLAGKDKPKEEDEHAPWWFTPLIVTILLLGNIWPAFGFTVLGLALLALGLIKLTKHVPKMNDIVDSIAMYIIAAVMKRKEKNALKLKQQ